MDFPLVVVGWDRNVMRPRAWRPLPCRASFDQNRPPRVTARDALHVHRLIGALLRSANEGRRIEIVAS